MARPSPAVARRALARPVAATGQKIFAIIRRFNADGLSILPVEQNAAVALAVSSYAYILENGDIGLEGPSEALRQDEAVKRTYLGS